MAVKHCRNGFTLIELFISVFVIVILIAFLLPAVRMARESARKVQCTNNLRQVGIGFANYSSIHDYLPPTIGVLGFSSFATILPFIEGVPLYASMNYSLAVDSSSNETAANQTIGTLLCPSDPSPGRRTGKTNYAANIGWKRQVTGTCNGLFVIHPEQPIGLAAVSDGMSNTAMVAEWVCGAWPAEAGDRLSRAYELEGDLWKPAQFDKAIEICSSVNPDGLRSLNRKGWTWSNGSPGLSAYSHNMGINGLSCINTEATSASWTAGSRHRSGANALFGDGHSRFLKSSMTIATWRAIGTRNGGESLSLSDL